MRRDFSEELAFRITHMLSREHFKCLQKIANLRLLSAFCSAERLAPAVEEEGGDDDFPLVTSKKDTDFPRCSGGGYG